MADTTARHVRVRGHVQGVFFRDSTRRNAQARDVTGWVRNDPDGTVEAWLEGPPDAVSDVEAWMRAGGPPRARVAEVDSQERDPRGHERFEIRH